MNVEVLGIQVLGLVVEGPGPISESRFRGADRDLERPAVMRQPQEGI